MPSRCSHRMTALQVIAFQVSNNSSLCSSSVRPPCCGAAVWLPRPHYPRTASHCIELVPSSHVLPPLFHASQTSDADTHTHRRPDRTLIIHFPSFLSSMLLFLSMSFPYVDLPKISSKAYTFLSSLYNSGCQQQ